LHQYALKGFLAIDDALQLAARIVSHMTIAYEGFGLHLGDGSLDFGEGRAVINPQTDGIMLFVGANDFLTGYGIRTLIEASVVAMLPSREVYIEWDQAEKQPLEAVAGRFGASRRKGQALSGGNDSSKGQFSPRETTSE
jgi:hypothetical protein